MQVTNQKPVTLSPVYKSNIQGDFDPVSYLKNTIVTPLWNPLVPSQNAKITSNGNEMSEDDITQYILACCQDTIDPPSEAIVKELYSKTLEHFDKNTNLTVQNTFSIQAAVQENMDFPSDTVVYTPAVDVIPASKSFMAGNISYEEYFATLAFYARPELLGFYFINEVAFNEFKEWLKNQILPLQTGFAAETNQLFADFDNLDLSGLTESLKIRNNETENNDDYSFARVLISLMMEYTKAVSPALYGVLPFTVSELFIPKNIVFVNVEKHAHATAKQIKDEWELINKALKMPIRMVSNNKLTKLTAVPRSMTKAAAQAATALSNMNNPAARAMRFKFRKTEMTTHDLARIMKKIIDKMAFVAKSENIYKSTKMTFARPNRRDPDDFNKQGKMVSTKYKPDIHLYIDTSGSISERNYQDAIKACIAMAKKLNVNLYFNSFSHVMSQTTHLRTKDKSKTQIYQEFHRVPKVTGGTDYRQIWEFINRNKKRRRELSIIITDFEWWAPNEFVKHPKNLFYVPCSHMDWKMITHSADSFCHSMVHIDPNIRKHVLL